MNDLTNDCGIPPEYSIFSLFAPSRKVEDGLREFENWLIPYLHLQYPSIHQGTFRYWICEALDDRDPKGKGVITVLWRCWKEAWKARSEYTNVEVNKD